MRIFRLYQPRPRRHASPTRWVHWASVFLMALVLGSIFLRGVAEEGWATAFLLDLHRLAGALVMLALVARLGLRWRDRHHTPRHRLPLAVFLASQVHHALLYLGLIAVPLLGWLLASASGRTEWLFGWLPMPALLGKDRDLADDLFDWHGEAAWALSALVLAHIGAALWHHFVRRDSILHAMLPERLVPFAARITHVLSFALRRIRI